MLTEPVSDYKRPHSTKIIMSTGKVFIPSMCKVSAAMKVSRLSANAKRSTVLQENSETNQIHVCSERALTSTKILFNLKECSPMLLPAGQEVLMIVTCSVQVTFAFICQTIVPSMMASFLGTVDTVAAYS